MHIEPVSMETSLNLSRSRPVTFDPPPQAELQQLQAQQAQLLHITQSTRSLLDQPDSTVPPEEKQRLRATLDQLQAQHQDRLQSCQVLQIKTAGYFRPTVRPPRVSSSVALEPVTGSDSGLFIPCVSGPVNSLMMLSLFF